MTNHNFRPFLEHPRGDMGVKKGKTFPIPLMVTIKSSKFARVDNFDEKTDAVLHAVG